MREKNPAKCSKIRNDQLGDDGEKHNAVIADVLVIYTRCHEALTSRTYIP